jgi:hypothetical protein
MEHDDAVSISAQDCELRNLITAINWSPIPVINWRHRIVFPETAKFGKNDLVSAMRQNFCNSPMSQHVAPIVQWCENLSLMLYSAWQRCWGYPWDNRFIFKLFVLHEYFFVAKTRLSVHVVFSKSGQWSDADDLNKPNRAGRIGLELTGSVLDFVS